MSAALGRAGLLCDVFELRDAAEQFVTRLDLRVIDGF
jgi:hypothetical protein